MSDKDKIDLSMLLDDYLNDAKEGFQRINSALLALEKDHSQTEQLDEIFRAIHTLKSSSTMLEFSDIAELAHTCEDLLDQLRKYEVAVSGETIDVLFEVTDTLEYDDQVNVLFHQYIQRFVRVGSPFHVGCGGQLEFEVFVVD